MAHVITLDFTEEGSQELQKICRDGGHETSGEAIQGALALFKWLLDTTEAGDEVLIRRPDGVLEKIQFVTSDERRIPPQKDASATGI